jgi:hypothetical protein
MFLAECPPKGITLESIKIVEELDDIVFHYMPRMEDLTK